MYGKWTHANKGKVKRSETTQSKQLSSIRVDQQCFGDAFGGKQIGDVFKIEGPNLNRWNYV